MYTICAISTDFIKQFLGHGPILDRGAVTPPRTLLQRRFANSRLPCLIRNTATYHQTEVNGPHFNPSQTSNTQCVYPGEIEG